MGRRVQIVIDAADPARIAEFWAHALGYVLQPPPEGFDTWIDWATAMDIPEERHNDASAIVDPEGIGPRVYFQRVPESKTVKNRVHLDIGVGAGKSGDERRSAVDTEADRLSALGARRVEAREELGGYWIVMLDPEGNEFCVH